MGFDTANNRFQLSTDKFGSASTVNFTTLGTDLTTSMGMATGAGAAGSYVGTDVMGSLDKDGAFYTFAGAGQSVKINSFLTGAPKDLAFDVAGTGTGARGTLTFQRGYAAQMTKSITDMLDTKVGTLTAKVTTINKYNTDYADKLKTVEARYAKVLANYTHQFSVVNSTISSMNSLRTSLSSSLKTSTG
jgi:flagellar hook-associated protein 2